MGRSPVGCKVARDGVGLFKGELVKKYKPYYSSGVNLPYLG